MFHVVVIFKNYNFNLSCVKNEKNSVGATLVRVRLEMLLATINHRVVQVTVPHIYIVMKVSLVWKSCVVEAAALKVAVFKENFASGK